MNAQQFCCEWIEARIEAFAAGGFPKISLSGYLVLLAILRDEPMTIDRLCEVTTVDEISVRILVSHMYAIGRLHVVGYQPRVDRQKYPHPIFAYGPGEDAPHPPYKRARWKPWNPKNIRANVVRLGEALDAITEPAAPAEFRERTRMRLPMSLEFLRNLHVLGLGRVAYWETRPQGGAPIPVYVLRAGRSAPKPSAFVLRQERRRVAREWRERQGPYRTPLNLLAKVFRRQPTQAAE